MAKRTKKAPKRKEVNTCTDNTFDWNDIYIDTRPTVCPACGYCPTCGRGNENEIEFEGEFAPMYNPYRRRYGGRR
jgi:hypothetical protein